jgi:hypothetical protein
VVSTNRSGDIAITRSPYPPSFDASTRILST